VPAGRVHEQLERVERARRSRRGLRRDGGADGHVALVECDLERRDLVLGQLVLVGERLELFLLDKTALGSLLDEALGRCQIVQMRVSQWDRPLSVLGSRAARGPRGPGAGRARDFRSAPVGYL
jgi:hypothetical protein